MKTKHLYVAVLDVGEILPFVVQQTKTVAQSIKEQDRAKGELVAFIDVLSKKHKQPTYYMGMDLIAGKTYERFIFEKGGFFEVMTEAPVAMNAHFVHETQAKDFCAALKKTLTQILPKNEISKMLIDSIEVNSESDQSLTYEEWDIMKGVKKSAK